MNPRCAPQRVGRRHLANQHADVGWHRRPTRAMSALPGPEQAKAAPMPSEDGRRLHDIERGSPGAPSARQPHPQHPINGHQAKSRAAAAIRDDQLVPQCEDL